ncbi:hypothetical protein BC827DRAFT_1303257 [Russula dissimulans]|nr:hypothetical protein BC827DRAFT_1303257 [Russula dissimulans]
MPVVLASLHVYGTLRQSLMDLIVGPWSIWTSPASLLTVCQGILGVWRLARRAAMMGNNAGSNGGLQKRAIAEGGRQRELHGREQLSPMPYRLEQGTRLGDRPLIWTRYEYDSVAKQFIVTAARRRANRKMFGLNRTRSKRCVENPTKKVGGDDKRDLKRSELNVPISPSRFARRPPGPSNSVLSIIESALPLYINPPASSFFLPLPHITPPLRPSMLGFDPFAPSYPPHVHDNDSFLRFHPMQADPIAYNPYSPSPTAVAKFALTSPLTPSTPTFPSSPAFQSFTFDPFADEDSSTSSGASERERERELEVQRLRGIELLRRREWMRRVVAWVDGVSHGTTPSLSPSSASSKSAPSPRPYNYTQQPDLADSPTLYYSSSQSLGGRSDEDEEPYLIYSTPLPGTSQLSFVPPSPSPSPPVHKPVAQAPAYTPAVPPPHISPPPQAPSSRRIHGRMRSLSSIREEDEGGAA